MQHLTNLTCEYRENPAGIETAHPRFGWAIESDRPGDRQSAYHIRVASSSDRLAGNTADLWDSGKAPSQASINITYAGRPLADRSAYFWTVQTWDRDDRPGGASPVQQFITGIAPQNWRASWIWDSASPLGQQHRYLRKAFDLPPKPIACAVAYVSADEYYHLFINGARVGMGPTPSFAAYQHYNTLDVTALLKAGSRNAIAAHVLYSHRNDSGYTGGDNRMGFILQLEIHFADGERLTLLSDAGWKVAVPAHNGCWGQETIRDPTICDPLPLDNWKQADYNDRGWTPAVPLGVGPIPGRWDRLVSQDTDPLRLPAIRPVQFVDNGKGNYFIDFGREAAGYLCVRFCDGIPMRRVIMRFAEEKITGTDISRAPEIYYPPRCLTRVGQGYPHGAAQQIVCRLQGGGEGWFDDQFDYMGFRYVQLYNAPRLTEQDVTMRVRTCYTEADEAKSSFVSSSLLLNRIWDLVKYTLWAATGEHYFDCPTRERGQYLGDALITAWGNFYAYGHVPLTRKLLRNIIQDVTLSGHPAPRFIVPAGASQDHRALDYSLEWAILLWEYFMFTGDTVLLAESYPHVKAMLDYFHLHVYVNKTWPKARGRNEPIWDWGSEMDEVPVYNPRVVGDTLFNAFYYAAVQRFALMADALGRPLEAQGYRERAESVKIQMNAPAMWTEAGYRNYPSANASLHANTIALWAGVVPLERRAAVVEAIKRKGLYCGVYFAFFVLQALYQAGEGEYALSLLEAPDEGDDSWKKTHRWSHMVSKGATTTWETWDPIKYANNQSLFHPWATCPAIIIPSEIMGIKPLAPGYREFQVRPQPATLQQADLTVPTLHGGIRVRFDRRERGRFRLWVSVPVNTVAQVCVPAPAEAAVVGVNGQERSARWDGRYLCLDGIASGEHAFAVDEIGGAGS